MPLLLLPRPDRAEGPPRAPVHGSREGEEHLPRPALQVRQHLVDIQGGEPTIWRHIEELVAYCHEIGLYPTLITNAIALAKRRKCEQLKQAGIRDLLISVQGLGPVYDEIVGLPGGR